jgi:alpha-glucosidase
MNLNSRLAIVPCLGLLLAATACKQGPFLIANESASVLVRVEPFSLEVRDASGKQILRTLENGDATAYGAPGGTVDDAVWVQQILSGWDGYQAHEGAWSHAASARVLGLGSTAANLQLGHGDATILMQLRLDGPRLQISLQELGGAANKIGVAFQLDGDEQFFGLGERYESVDHRGLSLYDWAEEGGLGAGESAPLAPTNQYPNGPSMTYYPVPFLLSSNGYGIALRTSARSEFHLGSERADAFRIASESRALELAVYIHDNPLDTIAAFTGDVGRPGIPAPWAFGPRREVGVGDQVNGVPEWQALRAAGVPTTTLDDNVHFLPARSESGREAQLAAWTAQLHAEGFKVLGYVTPYVSTTLSSAAADLQYGIANGLFVLNAQQRLLEVFFSSGQPQKLATIDLTNPAAVSWFQSLMQRPVDLGYDGWMHDFGEYVPHDALFHDGSVGLDTHNLFPYLSAKAAHDLLEKDKPGDYFFYARSGWAGSGAVAAGNWSGDPEATFDETQGLPAQLRAGLNLSMSGAPYWGSDIGGYKCLTSAPNDKEVYLRWAELGAVSPMMFNDTACSTVTGPAKHKWTIWSDAETTQIYGRLALLHTRLAPYLQALAVTAHATGQPLMLQPFLLFPTRAEARAVDDWFFLGRALLAAPVVRRGQLAKSLWLPPGRYVDLRDLSLYEGDQTVQLPAPLEQLPLLLVAGQLLPLLDASVQTLAPATDPKVISAAQVADRLDLQVALSAGQSASFTLADGTRLTASRDSSGAGTSGNPAGLGAVAASDLPDCALCYRSDAVGAIVRIRLNSGLAASSSLQLGDLRLTAVGAVARRFRWDVLELP